MVMEQLWSHMHMCAKHPVEQDSTLLSSALSHLHLYKVDWTNAALWPADYVQGQWTRVVPMAFLVANIGRRRMGSMGVIKALCSGE